jgi:hypothetical protein
MRHFLLLPVAAALFLGGCATPAQRATEMQRQMDEMVTVYGPACTKLGYQAHTDKWRDCILRLDARDSYLRGYPLTTSCFGNGGFLDCMSY